MNPFWIEIWVRGRVRTIATAITTSESNRSDHGARLKKNHHTRISTEKSSPPNVAISPASSPNISASGATAGRMDLKKTSSTAAMTPGQRRSGFRTTVSLVLGTGLLFFRRGGVHDATDGVHHLRPSVTLARQLRLAHRRQAVILRSLVGLAHVPLRFQPPALLQAVQCGIEGPCFNLEQVIGLRADRLSDAVPMLRAPLESPQDQHVERALEQVQALVFGGLGHGVDSLRL